MLDNLGLGLPPGGPLVGRPRPKRGVAQTLAPSLLQAAPSPLPPPLRRLSPLPPPHQGSPLAPAPSPCPPSPLPVKERVPRCRSRGGRRRNAGKLANRGESKGKEKERILVPALVWVFVNDSSRVTPISDSLEV